MKYVPLMYSKESDAPKAPEAYQAAAQAWGDFGKEAQSLGAVFMHGLSSVTDATTVRVRGGKTLTPDGPFAETHDELRLG